MTSLPAHHPHDPFFGPASLRLLVALEEHGGMGAVARALGMSQANVSRTISGLERHLGYSLVERSHTGSSLTTQGLALVAQARSVLAEQERLARLADALGAGGPARLELAASRTIGEHLVPGWLGLQAARDPDTWVSFRFDNSAHVARLVRTGQVPLGFLEDPRAPEDLASEELCRDRLTVVVPLGHAWAGKPVLPWEVAAAPLVEREPGSGTRATLDGVIPRRARPAAELDSNAAIGAAVAAGGAPAVLSRLAVARAIEAGEVAEAQWAGPELARPLLAVWREGSRVPAEVRDFLRLVRADCALR